MVAQWYTPPAVGTEEASFYDLSSACVHFLHQKRIFLAALAYLGKTQTDEGVVEDGNDKPIDKAGRTAVSCSGVSSTLAKS